MRSSFKLLAWLAMSVLFFTGSFTSVDGQRPPPPPPPRPPSPPPPPPPPTPTPTPADLSDYGFLSFLPGTWVGTGFNLIALPNFDSDLPSTGPSPFRLLLSNTKEKLVFTKIEGAVPNRGSIISFTNVSGQPDIDIFGLQYSQNVNQTNTPDGKPQPIHTEVGTWLNIPATTVLPVQGQTLVRLATIPHGDSVLAQSTFMAEFAGSPFINTIDSFPITIATGLTINNTAYLAPYLSTTDLPPGITSDIVRNPNILLSRALNGQVILKTIVFAISTSPLGGIVNIPQVVRNADASRMDAIFWISTVQADDGSTFLQLQYTQTVELDFLGINWPHISIATLVKKKD